MLTVNEYFDGTVKSIALENRDGKATVGVMEPGSYEFGTSTVEVMKVISGMLTVQLPDADGFQDFPAGTEFTVAAGKKFQLEVEEPTAYLCLYR